MEFTAEEYSRVARGLIPEAMEDKWFIFLEADHLYFHRSWTGALIYQMRIRASGEKYVVDEVLVNRETSQYRFTSDDEDVALLSFLVNNFLLGKRTPFPLPANIPTDVPKGVHQHNFSGSGYPEIDSSEWKNTY